MGITIASDLGMKVLKLVLKKLTPKGARSDFGVLFDYITIMNDVVLEEFELEQLLKEATEVELIEHTIYDYMDYYNIADFGEKTLKEWK